MMRKTIAGAAAWASLGLALGVLPSEAVEGGTPVGGSHWQVEVLLASGRLLAAELDGRTDGHELWLRSSRGSAHLLRPVAWDRVRRARFRGEWMEGKELLRRVQAERPPVIPASVDHSSEPIVLNGPSSDVADTAVRSVRAARSEAVASLTIDATVANWDADVEPDGLLLDVYPRDGLGRPVAVDGTLEVELIVAGVGAGGLVDSFPTRGRWTERVRPSDFESGAARYRLPFSAIGFHPEHDLKAAPYGTLYARLSVPGQGVYSASESAVRVRPYSAVRDALQGMTGRRFFPQEQGGLSDR